MPGQRAKTGRALHLPMTDVVHDLLVARRALGNAQFVFPSYGRSGHIEEARAWLDAVHAATPQQINGLVHDIARDGFKTAPSAGAAS
jgi:hypothetical protein